MAMMATQGGSDARQHHAALSRAVRSRACLSAGRRKWFCSAPMGGSVLVTRIAADGAGNAIQIMALKGKRGYKSNAFSEIEYRATGVLPSSTARSSAA